MSMSTGSNSSARNIVMMHGDQTGEELLLDALRVLTPEVIGLDLDFQHFGFILEKRRAKNSYESAFEAVFAGKASTDLCGSFFADEVIERVGSKLEVWSGLRN